MDLPKNIPMEHLTNLIDILSTKLTGSTTKEIKAVNNNLTDKVIDAAVFVGLIRLQNSKFILTESGKKYYQANDQRGKNDAIRELLKTISIYNITTEYFHHNKIEKPTKLDVGSYWNEYFASQIKGLNEDDLTSAIIFFLRFLELASLGKFINAGRGRETRIDLNMVELAKYVTTNYSTTNISSPSSSDIKISQKPGKKDSQPPTEEELEEERNVSTSLSILKKLNPELLWSDLDSDGAKKLIIDKLTNLSNQNTVLNAKVEEYQKVEGINAVLKEKVHNLKTDNLFRASVNTIGGVVLGVAITMDQIIFQIIGSILGAILIVLSIFLKEREPENKDG